MFKKNAIYYCFIFIFFISGCKEIQENDAEIKNKEKINVGPLKKIQIQYNEEKFVFAPKLSGSLVAGKLGKVSETTAPRLLNFEKKMVLCEFDISTGYRLTSTYSDNTYLGNSYFNEDGSGDQSLKSPESCGEDIIKEVVENGQIKQFKRNGQMNTISLEIPPDSYNAGYKVYFSFLDSLGNDSSSTTSNRLLKFVENCKVQKISFSINNESQKIITEISDPKSPNTKTVTVRDIRSLLPVQNTRIENGVVTYLQQINYKWINHFPVESGIIERIFKDESGQSELVTQSFIKRSNIYVTRN